MIVEMVTVSSGGQIALPAEVLRGLEIEEGCKLTLLQGGERILLVPEESSARLIEDELGGFKALGMSTLQELWSNPEDEIWDEA